MKNPVPWWRRSRFWGSLFGFWARNQDLPAFRSNRRTRKRERSFRPSIEALETRELLTNNIPIGNPDFYCVLRGNVLSVNPPLGVLANDIDLDTDPLNVAGYTNPANGTLTLLNDGSFNYAPNEGFAGEDLFTYTVTDGLDEATTTVTIDVHEHIPIAAPDTYTVQQGRTLDTYSALLPSVLDNDSDEDHEELFALPASGPHDGRLDLFYDGHFVYTPNPGFSGEDYFTYRLLDGCSDSVIGNVTITVTNQAVSAVSDAYTVHQGRLFDTFAQGLPSLFANDVNLDDDTLFLVSNTEPAHGSLIVFDDGHFAYSPAPGWYESDSFTYTVSDGASEHSATVTITFADEAPAAQNDSYNVLHDRVFDTYFAELPSLLANDDDLDDDSLFIVSHTTPTRGTLSVGDDGHFTYTPDPGDLATYSFSYTVSDGAIETTGTVTLIVGDASPSAQADTFSVARNHVLDSRVLGLPGLLGNDTDADGDPPTSCKTMSIRMAIRSRRRSFQVRPSVNSAWIRAVLFPTRPRPTFPDRFHSPTESMTVAATATSRRCASRSIGR